MTDGPGDGAPPPKVGSLWAGKPVVSRRRLSRRRRALYGLLAPLAAGVAQALWWTCRVERVVGAEHLAALLREGRPCIPCFWHRHFVLCLHYVLGLPLRVGCLISPSVDGELATMIARRWGISVVRGSATRTGVKAMRDLYRAIAREGVSPIVMVDGPSGPPGTCKPGAVMLAQLGAVPLVPLTFRAAHALRLPTWDGLVVPLPFSRAVVAVGVPLTVARDLGAEALEGERLRLETALDALEVVAETALARR